MTVLLCLLMSMILLIGAVSAESSQETLRKVAGQTLRMKLTGSTKSGSDVYLDLKQSVEKHFDSRQIEGIKAGDRFEVMTDWFVEVYTVEPVAEGYLIRDDEFEYLFTKQADGTYTGMRKNDEYRFTEVSLAVRPYVSPKAVYIKFSEDGTYAVLTNDDLLKDVFDFVLYQVEAAEYTFNESGQLIAVQSGYAETNFFDQSELTGKGLTAAGSEKKPAAADQQESPAAADQSKDPDAITAVPNRASVNLREKPDKSSKKLIEIKKGTSVRILKEAKGKDGKTWYLVDADGVEGYIRSDMLTKQTH